MLEVGKLYKVSYTYPLDAQTIDRKPAVVRQNQTFLILEHVEYHDTHNITYWILSEGRKLNFTFSKSSNFYREPMFYVSEVVCETT